LEQARRSDSEEHLLRDEANTNGLLGSLDKETRPIVHRLFKLVHSQHGALLLADLIILLLLKQMVPYGLGDVIFKGSLVWAIHQVVLLLY
jgi:hypothetical protein